jgi:predicted translin family RNA/ssDNA-binding protein
MGVPDDLDQAIMEITVLRAERDRAEARLAEAERERDEALDVLREIARLEDNHWSGTLARAILAKLEAKP